MLKKFASMTAILVATCSVPAFASDKAPPMDAKMMEMMKKHEAYATPGSPHKMLADMAGQWNYTSKYWMDPQKPAEESTGTSSMKMVMGGRWLQQEMKGQAMGMPFEGMGMTGYNNLTGKYEMMWMDNMSTGVMMGTGTYDEAKKMLTDNGTMSCPMSADKTRDFRGEWKIVDRNKMVYSMYSTMPEGDSEFKQMELTFNRSKMTQNMPKKAN